MLETQLQRNDEDFATKYREFNRKIDELDVINRSYREAIQRVELRNPNSSALVESPLVLPSLNHFPL